MTGSRFAALAADLRHRITVGEFAADAGSSGALESEAALGRRYGVSRVTVRRALEELRTEGLVESRPGAGWFTVGAAFHQTLALGTFRHAASAVEEAGKNVVRRVVEFAYRPVSPAVVAALGVAPDAEVLFSRSVRSVDGVPLDLVDEEVPAGIAGHVSRLDAEATGIWSSLRQRGHQIDVVRQTITAGIATATDADLLQVVAGSPLLLVRRVASDGDGRALALSDHRYLAHRFSLEVEFRGWPTASAAQPPGLQSIPHQFPHTPHSAARENTS